MDKQSVRSALSILLALGACTSARPGETTTRPIPPGPADTGATAPLPVMSLVPGLSRYDLEQQAIVRVEGHEDSLPHTITTKALLLVEVLMHNDSSYDVTVSVDSLNQIAEGFGRSSPAHPTTLGSVLRVSFSPGGNSAQAQLPDSLCAYSQFVTVARHLVLPRIPAQLMTEPDKMPPDTMHIAGCRAGIHISVESTQEVRNLSGSPLQVSIEERATVKGSGMMQQDSVMIEGSLRAQGTASFTVGSRLPSLVQSQSEGAIKVELADSTVTFRQRITQHLRQRIVNSPN
jgi:hypothetical protein